MNRKNKPLQQQTPQQLQEALEMLHSSEPVKEPKADTSYYNYNIRIPIELYERMQKHIKKSGQNVKNFLLLSMEEYLDNHQK
jgi:predicted HicB family RNase H-like nuclease